MRWLRNSVLTLSACLSMMAPAWAADLFSDTFTYSNGSLSSANANWVVNAGLPSTVVSGNLIQTSGVGADSANIYTGLTWPDDQYAYTTVTKAITANNRAVCVLLRAITANETWYRVCALGPLGAGATAQIRRYNAAASTALASVTATINAGDILKGVVIGTATDCVKLYVAPAADPTNFSLVASSGVDGSPLTTGSAGLLIFVDAGTTADAQLDTWGGGNAGAVTGPPIGTLNLLGVGR